VQKKIRSLENALKRQQLPRDFSSRLEEFVCAYSSKENGDMTIEIAPTQADPCIAGMAVAGDIDFIVSGDSDFAMYVGPSGRRGLADIMLKDMKLSTKKEWIFGMPLVTGHSADDLQIQDTNWYASGYWT
jgi:hypothetical protein